MVAARRSTYDLTYDPAYYWRETFSLKTVAYPLQNTYNPQSHGPLRPARSPLSYLRSHSFLLTTHLTYIKPRLYSATIPTYDPHTTIAKKQTTTTPSLTTPTKPTTASRLHLLLYPLCLATEGSGGIEASASQGVENSPELY